MNGLKDLFKKISVVTKNIRQVFAEGIDPTDTGSSWVRRN